MKEQEINLGQKLPRYAVDLLAEELGIAGYLQEGQCTRAAYQPDKKSKIKSRQVFILD
jgi:hypothetical protein